MHLLEGCCCCCSTEHKLLKSEEDLQPLTRQRSNTLPKSFGSQLEKKPAQEKVPKPPAENTLESILKKLQEKREEAHRPEDIKVRPSWGRRLQPAVKPLRRVCVRV